jgi:hypothetical protein
MGDMKLVFYFVSAYSVVVLTSLWLMLGHRLKQSRVLIRRR